MFVRTIAACAAAWVAAESAQSAINGFNERFVAGSAGWRNANGAAELAWTAGGGPGGLAYASSTFNLSATTAGGFPPTVIRAHASYGSSGGAYVGNWIADGADRVTFLFRHDLSEAVTVTGRFATPTNAPGASVVAHGETNLVHLGGRFSHAIHKGARWDGDLEQSRGLVEPAADELALAQRVLAEVDRRGFGPIAYARVDLARGADGRPLLMELEIVEPSLFLDRAPARAPMLVDAVLCAAGL